MMKAVSSARILGVLLMLGFASSAYAYCSEGDLCPKCTNSPGNKQQWVHKCWDLQGNLTHKCTTYDACGSC